MAPLLTNGAAGRPQLHMAPLAASRRCDWDQTFVARNIYSAARLLFTEQTTCSTFKMACDLAIFLRAAITQTVVYLICRDILLSRNIQLLASLCG